MRPATGPVRPGDRSGAARERGCVENTTAGHDGAEPARILTDEEMAVVRRAVDALPPMTDEQIDGICEVITNARATWRAADARRRERTSGDE